MLWNVDIGCDCVSWMTLKGSENGFVFNLPLVYLTTLPFTTVVKRRMTGCWWITNCKLHGLERSWSDVKEFAWRHWETAYSDSLQIGRSGDPIPVVARFSASVQTAPGANSASYTMGTGSFPAVTRPGGGVNHTALSSTECLHGRLQVNLPFLLRDDQSARRDLNLGPPEFGAGWVTIGPQLRWNGF
jgi:hypothetical protein